MVDRIREVIPNAKLVSQQQPVLQLDAELPSAGVRRFRCRRQDVSAYDRAS